MNRRKAALIGLATALVASLGGNVALFELGTRYFRQTNAVRLDPLDLDFYPIAKPPPDPPAGKRRLVFLGDSRAFLWPTPAGLDGYEVVNRGISLQTTAQILERFDRHVAPLKPAVVVLELGVNDLKAIPLLPERRGAIVERCKTNIAKVVARSTDLGARVVLTTIFSLGEVPLTRRFYLSSEVGFAITEVNAYLRTLGSDRVSILEASPVLDDATGKVQPRYLLDFLHLSPAGYEALEPSLKAILDGLRF